MSVIPSRVNPRDATFKANRVHHLAALRLLEERMAQARAGGREPAMKRHRARGKLPVRERIQTLLDAGAPFLELSPLAAYGVYADQAPSAGIVTGVGRVSGHEVVIVANDATVKGGSYFPLTVKKHLRAQEVALQNALPCIYLVDSGGANLPLWDDVFPDREHFGRIFYNQAQMSAQGIPQVAVVMGSCTAGGAYIPAMSDETVIVKGHGTIFLGGPPLVKAATGEEVTANELGGAEVHAFHSGVADHYAHDDLHALALTREICAHFRGAPPTNHAPQAAEPPRYDPEEMLGLLPADIRQPCDMEQIIARLVDGSRFHAFKPKYGEELICGFAHIEGYPVGILANQGVLFSECALKGAHFIQLAAQRGFPLVFLQNISGFMVGKEYERRGIAKDGAKLVTAVSTCGLPRFTVVVGGSYGAGNYGMCGRAYSPNFLWLWPSARVQLMGSQQAATVLSTVRDDNQRAQGKSPMDAAAKAAFEKPILEQFDRQGSPYYGTARLWDDGIISPLRTRQALALGMSAALRKPRSSESRFGVFRM